MAPSHRSSPQETIRIISPRRSNEIDYGHDGGHQIRHITRSTRLDAFAGEGTPRGWSWVLQSLTYRRSDRGLGCPVSILDTVIYASDGSPETLYYTDGENAVASRTIGEDQGCITFADAIVHLERSKTRTDAAETTGAVAFTLGGEVVSIKTADLAKIRKGQGTVPNATQALVLSVSTKAPPAEPLLSVQHTFALEASSAKPLHRSYRLAMMKGAARRVPCQSATVNRELMRVCNKVLEWIEARSGARVLRLILEFVEDDLGRLLLVRASKCFVTETVRLYSQERQSPSPSQSKTARLQIADRIANELSILRYGHGIGESIPSSAGGLAAAVSRPEVTSLRQMELARKAHTAMSRADASNDQGPVDPVEWGFHQSPSPLRVADAYRPKTTASARTSRKRALGREVDNDIGSMFRKFASPEERYPREVGRTVAAGRALGSTQLGRMCHGDFCVTELPDKVNFRPVDFKSKHEFCVVESETFTLTKNITRTCSFLGDASAFLFLHHAFICSRVCVLSLHEKACAAPNKVVCPCRLPNRQRRWKDLVPKNLMNSCYMSILPHRLRPPIAYPRFCASCICSPKCARNGQTRVHVAHAVSLTLHKIRNQFSARILRRFNNKQGLKRKKRETAHLDLPFHPDEIGTQAFLPLGRKEWQAQPPIPLLQKSKLDLLCNDFFNWTRALYKTSACSQPRVDWWDASMRPLPVRHELPPRKMEAMASSVGSPKGRPSQWRSRAIKVETPGSGMRSPFHGWYEGGKSATLSIIRWERTY